MRFVASAGPSHKPLHHLCMVACARTRTTVDDPMRTRTTAPKRSGSDTYDSATDFAPHAVDMPERMLRRMNF